MAAARKKIDMQKIGEGQIGIEALVRVMKHEKLRSLPFILETPTDDDGHQIEIEILKKAYVRIIIKYQEGPSYGHIVHGCFFHV